MCSRHAYELILESLEPFVRGYRRLNVLLEDPAVLHLLGVRDTVPELHRILERHPPLVAKRDLELLPKPDARGLVDRLNLVEQLEVLRPAVQANANPVNVSG
jgi:hypothetical protein